MLGTTRFRAALDWYLEVLGLIVSDFLYLDGQRERGPARAFIRCDRGSVPADHHTLAMALQPRTGYLHSAYQLTDLDEVAASGEYLRQRGYRHAWGLGRHIQGSQIFDYWRDRDRLMFEHYADGDVFDAAAEPGWAPLSVSGLAQWGPKATAEFTGARDPGRRRGGDQGAARQGQRDRSRRPARPGQRDELMSANLARTADGWWVVTPTGLVRLGLPAATTARLLADRPAVAGAIDRGRAGRRAAGRGSRGVRGPPQPGNRSSSGGGPDGELPLPRSGLRPGPGHRAAGLLPQGLALPHGSGRGHHPAGRSRVPRLRGRTRPGHRTDLAVGTTVTDDGLSRYVAALVVTDDVSARQIQLIKTQFYKAKSYPTFTPVGPWLTLVEAAPAWPGCRRCG